MDQNGGKARTLYTSTYATQFAPSPDGKWMAFTELFNCYITPMVTTGGIQELSANNRAIPISKVSKDAGIYMHWSKDSQQLFWTLGSQYFSREIKNTFPFVNGSPEKLHEPD